MNDKWFIVENTELLEGKMAVAISVAAISAGALFADSPDTAVETDKSPRLQAQNVVAADHVITADPTWAAQQSPEAESSVRRALREDPGLWRTRGLGPPPLVEHDLRILRERLKGLSRSPEGMRVDHDRAYELMWREKPHRFLVRVRGNGRYDWSHWNGDTSKLVIKENVRIAGRDRGLLKRLRRHIG